jgi:HSP20 family protein
MLVRYRQPWYLSSRVNSEFDRLMAEAFVGKPIGFSPAADVATEGTDIVISLDIPGVAAEDVDIALDGRRLTIAGERAERTVADGDRVLRRGLSRGKFTRTFTVPAGTKADQVTASAANGLLHVRVAEVIKPKTQPHKIAVTGAAAIEGDARDTATTE